MLSVWGQQLSPDTLLNRIHQQLSIYPQEKLHLHTDRNIYMAGDTAWMKAYIVDAMSHCPVYKSRYVYVELINPFNQLESRVKLRQDSLGMIYGYIALQDTLPSGDYFLRGYTRFMENEGKEYFFRKQIKVLSPLEKSVQLQVQRDGQGKLCLDFHKKSSGEPLSFNHASVFTGKEELHSEKHGHRISLPQWNGSGRTLLVKAGNYRQYITCDADAGLDYEVSFMPEGGELISGALCKVAFKAVNANGLGEDIDGKVVDENGDVIVFTRSFHRGMGHFTFIPLKGKTYRMVCSNKSGLEKTFPLPEAGLGKYALKIRRNQGNFHVSYLSEHKQRTDSLFLLVHQRGLPQFLQPWFSGSEEWVFDAESFERGMVSFMLLDVYGNVLSERLAFVLGEGEYRPVMKDSMEYAPYSKVVLSLCASDLSGKPLEGHASVAVTDNADILPDSLTSILSSLLLTSELKGHVEEPHWYFRDTDWKKQEALDLLMLTQGWRRYHFRKVVKERQFDLPRFSPEESMSIKGQVLSTIRRKPKEKALVRVMIPAGGGMEEVIADDEGMFSFQGFELPDSTGCIIMAQSANEKNNVLLEVEKEAYPSLDDTLPVMPYSHQERPWLDYLEKMNERLAYENGMRHIFLDEVLVTASRNNYVTNYQMMADEVITAEMIKESGASTFEMLLRMFVGFRLSKKNILYVLDETPLEGDMVEQVLPAIRLEDIRQIDILIGIKCAGYFSGKQDAIVAITLNPDGAGTSWSPTNITHILPLGYQKRADFYVPKYDVADKVVTDRDLRTTIHWQPDVVFKGGKAEVVFYAAGIPTTYSVVLEGITEEGCVLREVKKLVVSKESNQK